MPPNDFPRPSPVPQGVNEQAQRNNQIATDFFVYNTVFNTVLNQTSQTNNIQIQADSDFEIQKLTAQYQPVLTADIELNDSCMLTVLVTDTGTGRQLSDIAVPLNSLFGTAQLPFILPNTKIMKARSILAIQLTNFSTSVNYARVQLSFVGRKIFRGFQ